MSNAYPSPVYSIAGMTCHHCTLSVREEVEEIPGVTTVDVDLASGRMTVTGTGFGDDAVRAAVAEAGYEVIL
jgi:copper chaperone